MRIEELFNLIDKALKLSDVYNFLVLGFSAFSVFILSVIILRMALNEGYVHVCKKEHSRGNTLVLLFSIVSSSLMIAGLIHSIYEYTVDILVVLGVLTYIFTLVLLNIRSIISMRFSTKFLIYFLPSMLLSIFFSSKVLINGVDATETTTDTLQIYYEGRFYFSRHASWYDLAPVDAIMKNFLIYVLGIDNPYDPVTTTLMFSALSISVLVALLAFINRLGKGDLGNYAPTLILIMVHPYSLLIGMSTPPTNYSLVLSMFVLLVISKVIYNVKNYFIGDILIVLVFTTIAVVAHPMSIIIPAYLIAIYLYGMVDIRDRSKSFKYVSALLVLSFMIFTLKALYTGLREGLLTLARIIIEGLTSLLSYEVRDINVYIGGPQPPKSSFFSFGAFPGVIAAIFLVEIVSVLRKKRADYLSIFVLSVALIMSALSVVTNFFYPSSRYIGYPAIVLGAFQSTIYVTRLPKNRWRDYFIVLLGILCLFSVISPNAMIEHYNVFTGGRWPRVENFVLSGFLVEYVNTGYVIDVFRGSQEARLHLYFTQDILLYGHPYHHINTLIVEKFLIPGIIEARSYWDFSGGKLFLKYEDYIDLGNRDLESVILNGWRWIATWS